MRKRKLLTQAVLEDIYYQRKLGVPLTKIVAAKQYGLSRPALAVLLKAYENQQSTTVRNSLFPEWLDNAISTAQEEPNNYTYLGKFPNGEWYEVN